MQVVDTREYQKKMYIYYNSTQKTKKSVIFVRFCPKIAEISKFDLNNDKIHFNFPFFIAKQWKKSVILFRVCPKNAENSGL